MGELPPLPADRMTVLSGAMKGDYFTADQMRAYAQQAARQEREACEKVCEDVASKHFDEFRAMLADGAYDCAAAIRSRSSEAVDKVPSISDNDGLHSGSSARQSGGLQNRRS
jgi:hypothetical protein